MLRSALALAAQLLWPARCAGCDLFTPPEASFCPVCDTTLLPLAGACAGCALPVSLGGGCARCHREPLPFATARAAVAYGGAVIDALLRFKHGDRPDLARPLGRVLLPPLLPALDGSDAVLPVPLHPRRLRARGFNQALELIRAARALAPAATAWPALRVDTLRRTRDTPALGHFSPADRRALVDGAFTVAAPDQIRGGRIVVVDDVMTSGATLAACARTLLAAGAREVRVVALARAL